MPATGGSVQDITIRGRLFATDSEEKADIVRGGWKNEVKINGNGTARYTRTRIGWKIGGLKVTVDNAREDYEFLKECADSGEDLVCTITLADGTVLQGTGQIVDDIKYDTKDTVAEIELQGGGELTAQ